MGVGIGGARGMVGGVMAYMAYIQGRVLLYLRGGWGMGMIENLLPGIELADGDCGTGLPGLPPADLILTSPPYDSLWDYGGYDGAFQFDAVAAAGVANLAPGGGLVWGVGDRSLTAANAERVSGRRWGLWGWG